MWTIEGTPNLVYISRYNLLVVSLAFPDFIIMAHANLVNSFITVRILSLDVARVSLSKKSMFNWCMGIEVQLIFSASLIFDISHNVCHSFLHVVPVESFLEEGTEPSWHLCGLLNDTVLLVVFGVKWVQLNVEVIH